MLLCSKFAGAGVLLFPTATPLKQKAGVAMFQWQGRRRPSVH